MQEVVVKKLLLGAALTFLAWPALALDQCDPASSIIDFSRCLEKNIAAVDEQASRLGRNVSTKTQELEQKIQQLEHLNEDLKQRLSKLESAPYLYRGATFRLSHAFRTGQCLHYRDVNQPPFSASCNNTDPDFNWKAD
jgi:hypothetical protein